MDIESIRSKFKTNRYRISQHGEEERELDRITFKEIEEAIENSEIIERYPDDPRGPSCLIFGLTKEKKPIHLVCGNLLGERIILVTVYRPEPRRWIDFKKRRKES